MYGKAGCPDILMFCRGVFFGLEVKRPGNKSTPLQKKALRDIASCPNAVAALVTNVEDTKAVIRAAEFPDFRILNNGVSFLQ